MKCSILRQNSINLDENEKQKKTPVLSMKKKKKIFILTVTKVYFEGLL